jgi:hypothetical protein
LIASTRCPISIHSSSRIRSSLIHLSTFGGWLPAQHLAGRMMFRFAAGWLPPLSGSLAARCPSSTLIQQILRCDPFLPVSAPGAFNLSHLPKLNTLAIKS